MEHLRENCICTTANQAFQNLIDSIINLRLFNRNINSNGLSINDSGVNNSNTPIDINPNHNETLIIVFIIITLISILLKHLQKMNRKGEKSKITNQNNNSNN
jgi:hypothetical protein